MLIKIILIFLTTQIILLTKIQARNNKYIINIEHQKAKNFFVHNLTSNILKHVWEQNNSKNDICSILHGRDKAPTKDEINGNINISEEIEARIRTKVYMNFMQLTNTKLYDLEKSEIEYEGTGIKEIEDFLFKAKFNIPAIKEKKDRIWRARCAFDLFLLRIIVELYLALSETELNIIRNINGELINYRLGGEEIINKINKWFDEFGELNKESYKLYENKYKGNIKIVLYNEEDYYKIHFKKKRAKRVYKSILKILNEYEKNKKNICNALMKSKVFKDMLGDLVYHKGNAYKELRNFFINIKRHIPPLAKHRSCAYKLFVFRGFLEFALVMDQLINKTSSIKYGQIINNAITNVDELIYKNNKLKDNSRRINNHKKIRQFYYETLIPNLKNYLHVEFKHENDKSDGLEINRNDDNKLENILGEDEEENEEEASYLIPEAYQAYNKKENSGRSLASVMLNKNEEELNSFAFNRQ